MELGLGGRSVLVTGASRGIGRAIAEVFAYEGCKVHIIARHAEDLHGVRNQLARYGSEVCVHAADLSQQGAASAVCAMWPDIDVLVNNAGSIPRGDVLEVDEDRWRAGWELKVFGYINMTRAYYRRMCRRRRGVIINVIGIGAEKLDYGYAAGSAGNAALVAFTRTVGSVSFDYGVRVLGVNPGWVETDRAIASLRQRSTDLLGDAERWRELLAEWPGGRLIRPAEIADAVCFLASERASAFSGHVITVDCGFAARSYTPAPVVPPPPVGETFPNSR